MKRAVVGIGRTAIVVAIIGLSCGEIREDEMDCEEAEARLAVCCPQLDTSHLSCVYEHSPHSCNEGNYDLDRPDFTIAASNCIRTRKCEELGQACDALAGVRLDHACQFQEPGLGLGLGAGACDSSFQHYAYGEETGLQRQIEAAACR
jgi:hypothetical protein